MTDELTSADRGKLGAGPFPDGRFDIRFAGRAMPGETDWMKTVNP